MIEQWLCFFVTVGSGVLIPNGHVCYAFVDLNYQQLWGISWALKIIIVMDGRTSVSELLRSSSFTQKKIFLASFSIYFIEKKKKKTIGRFV